MLILRINHLVLILFVFTLGSSYGNSNSRKQTMDENLRGSSFGLESFIFQPLGEAKPDNKDNIKRMRPIGSHRPTPIPQDRGQTYGLENFSVRVYGLDNLQPLLVNTEFHSRRIPAANKQNVKVPIVNKISSKTTADFQTVSRSSPSPDIVTERSKKRIMLRKRRKRPSNTTQAEKGNDFFENGNVSAHKLPVFHSVPPVKNKILIEDSLQNKVPVEVSFQPNNKKELKTETFAATERSEYSTIRKTKTTTQTSPMNLKEFLKQQTETLSLSELLQTRNLSLADLLKGSKDASEFLKGQQSTAPPNLGLKRKGHHKAESTTENLQRFDKIYEHTTREKLVEVTSFRPSHNRYNQKIPKIKFDKQLPNVQEDQRKDKNDIDEGLTTKKVSFDSRSRVNELRLKLRNFQRRTQTPGPTVKSTNPTPTKETIISLLPFSSTIFVNSTESPYKNKTLSQKTNNSEASLTSAETVSDLNRSDRISNLLKRLPSLKKFGKDKIRTSENLIKKQVKIPDLENDNDKNSEENQSRPEIKQTTPLYTNELNITLKENLKLEENVEENDNLFELLKSEQNANKLQKILHERNMTLQEVLENRERPTVQSNIAELFANHQKKVSYSTQPFQAIDDDGLPNFMEKKINKESLFKVIDVEEPYAEESVTTIAKLQLQAEEPKQIREPKKFENFFPNEKEGKLNLQPNDLAREKSKENKSELWNLYENPNLSFPLGDAKSLNDVTERGNSDEESSAGETKYYESTLHKLNQKFEQEDTSQTTNFEDEPVTEDVGKSYIPPAVKSAIVASGAVMGIALFVFIAILAACGWKQRQLRLKSASSILKDTLNKQDNKSKNTNTLTPVNFKEKKYKKTTDFDDDSSESGTSTTGSYLWNTLKNTFAYRSNTLKSRLEKEEKMKINKMTLDRFESRRAIKCRHEDRSNNFQIEKDRFQIRKIDRDRNVINTSFNFRRSLSPSDIGDFSECPHGF